MQPPLKRAVLMAAGRGSRLGRLTTATPKPLLEIGGISLIEHVVEGLHSGGIDQVIVVAGYLAEKIEAWCARYASSHRGLQISALRQKELNGTGGAMLAARVALEGEARFVFGWADILMDQRNYARFIGEAGADDSDLVLAVNRTRDPWRGAAVYLDNKMGVRRIVEKPAPGTSSTNWNNAGLFASGPLLFDYLRRLDPSPRGEIELPQAIALMVEDGLRVRAIDVRGFWTDVGTPEDLELARVRLRHSTPWR